MLLPVLTRRIVLRAVRHRAYTQWLPWEVQMRGDVIVVVAALLLAACQHSPGSTIPPAEAAKVAAQLESKCAFGTGGDRMLRANAQRKAITVVSEEIGDNGWRRYGIYADGMGDLFHIYRNAGTKKVVCGDTAWVETGIVFKQPK